MAKLVVQTPPTSVLGPTSERKVFVGFVPFALFSPPPFLFGKILYQANQLDHAENRSSGVAEL